MTSIDPRFAALENRCDGRLGVYAYDVGRHTRVAYRPNERFPVCSTFKLILIGAILARGARVAGLMQQRLRYASGDVVPYSPVTAQHVAAGMTVEQLCRAALQHSDNTAANLLMRLLGGPGAVTAYARSIGDEVFRLDRWETALNDAVPGDPRDTSTPAAMARSMHALVLGDALPPSRRDQLRDWLRGNRTGANRIRAALPRDWDVGDKTGAGDYGTTNDIAVLWPPARAPIVLAVYLTQRDARAKVREDIVAAAARVVLASSG